MIYGARELMELKEEDEEKREKNQTLKKIVSI
jgi:hypothetical protein